MKPCDEFPDCGCTTGCARVVLDIFEPVPETRPVSSTLDYSTWTPRRLACQVLDARLKALMNVEGRINASIDDELRTEMYTEVRRLKRRVDEMLNEEANSE